MAAGLPFLRVRFNQLLKDLPTINAKSGIDKRAVLEEQQRRCSAYAKTFRKFRVIVDLDGADAHAWWDFGRELCEHARELLARDATFGPEVDDRQPRLPQNFGVEIPFVPNCKVVLVHGRDPFH